VGVLSVLTRYQVGVLACLWQVDLRDYSETLGATLSEQDGGTLLDKLWPIHESKLDYPSVVYSHGGILTLHNLCCLSYYSTMDNCLIIWLDCRRLLNDYHSCFKVINWLRFSLFIKQDHSFSEVVSLELLFLDLSLNAEADSLTCFSNLDINSLVMDCFHLDWIKSSLFVWSKQ